MDGEADWYEEPKNGNSRGCNLDGTRAYRGNTAGGLESYSRMALFDDRATGQLSGRSLSLRGEVGDGGLWVVFRCGCVTTLFSMGRWAWCLLAVQLRLALIPHRASAGRVATAPPP